MGRSRRVAIASNKSSVKEDIERLREGEQACGFFAPENDIHFKPMDSFDLEEIMAIEKASFSYPWSPQFFLQELSVSCARSLLATVGGKTVGYIVYWLLPSEVDIHNLAVHLAHRRQGVGRSLLQVVIDEAKRSGLSRITLEVRKSNEAARRLYQSLGFLEQGVRKGYYSDDGEDAVAMVLEVES